MILHDDYPCYLEYKRWSQAFEPHLTVSFEEWLKECELAEANL